MSTKTKTPKRELTEHDVDVAIEQASVEKQAARLRFAKGALIILVSGYVLNTCLSSPDRLPAFPKDPSIECTSRGNVWHPESFTDGFFTNKIEAYCAPAAPCVETKK